MITHLTQQDFVVSTWSGGTTTQLAISPEGAVYADRDFLWRISSATVALASSDFTPLPDYTRFIASLDAPIVLSHNGGQPITLHALDVHQFDGADETTSKGCCTDFNLMIRKGHGSATVTKVVVDGVAEVPSATTVALFCVAGNLSALGYPLRAGEMLLAENSADFSVEGHGTALICNISVF